MKAKDVLKTLACDCGIGDAGIAKLNLKKLHADCNPKITNVNHMNRLKILFAGNDCGIDDAGFAELNLKELHREGNKKLSKKLIKK